LEPESLQFLPQVVEKEADAAGLREGSPVSLGLAVGPERGWSTSELGLIAQRGLTTAGLGRRILRAETAGAVAAAVSRFALNDF
jgi:16S rRNA (uracil1498-N3)-methyltransferase